MHLGHVRSNGPLVTRVGLAVSAQGGPTLHAARLHRSVQPAAAPQHHLCFSSNDVPANGRVHACRNRAGGLVGAGFNQLNKLITIQRKKYITKVKRLAGGAMHRTDR